MTAEVELRSRLVDNLRAETDHLVELLGAVEESVWRTTTPAAGWSVKDQVSHLAVFDEVTTTALVEPEEFGDLARSLPARGPDWVDLLSKEHRQRSGTDVLAWFGQARDSLIRAISAAAPGVRAPWFGPAMSVASMVTARIMETWAHGRDVYDALGEPHPLTDALWDVCDLGVRTRGHAFATHGLEAPPEPVVVRLWSASGEERSWPPGPDTDGSSQSVSGSAEEFALVVTRRRGIDQAELDVQGAGARSWMELAQAFAGPPGPSPQSRALPSATAHRSASSPTEEHRDH